MNYIDFVQQMTPIKGWLYVYLQKPGSLMFYLSSAMSEFISGLINKHSNSH
jgi:hypothetical protein